MFIKWFQIFTSTKLYIKLYKGLFCYTVKQVLLSFPHSLKHPYLNFILTSTKHLQYFSTVNLSRLSSNNTIKSWKYLRIISGNNFTKILHGAWFTVKTLLNSFLKIIYKCNKLIKKCQINGCLSEIKTTQCK